jgi:hypothetical protein
MHSNAMVNLRSIALRSLAGTAIAFALVAGAQTPAPTPTPASSQPAAQTPAPAAPADAAPAPLSTFVLTGPLTWLPPAVFDAGPFGKISVNGILTGFAQGQNNPVTGDDTKQATLSNGEIFIQKADGKLQWFVQAGVYTMPTLGTAYLSAQDTNTNFYGPVPVAFLKLATGKTTTWQIGALPTLMGAESTFTYQNFDIERGLLWAQENAVNRGLQVNQTLGKYFTASLSWNDGYYSNRYSWLSGSLTFTKGPHSLVYDGMGNMSQTVFQTAATPVQNNGTMHTVIYTYAKGAWIVQPYFQYGNVPTNKYVGIAQGTSATGGALSISRAFKSGFALPGRFEYIATSGSVGGKNVNLLFGPGSSATSFTVTPTYQKGGFFFRTDISVVHAMNYTIGETISTTGVKRHAAGVTGYGDPESSYIPGDVFGPLGNSPTQFRAAGEFGFIFGDNIVKK